MQQVKGGARKWQDAEVAGTHAAGRKMAGTQQQDARWQGRTQQDAGRQDAAEWRSIVIQFLKECKDAQLCKFLSEFKNLH
jgi:hypothetical protein